MAFNHISFFPPFISLFLTPLAGFLSRPLPAHVSPFSLALSEHFLTSPLHSLWPYRGSLHQRRSRYSFSFCLLLFLSLEKNHTLISLPALFLTSRLARRILTKLLSQLTPKAHNNLLCQQTHSRGWECTSHTHTHAGWKTHFNTQAGCHIKIQHEQSLPRRQTHT